MILYLTSLLFSAMEIINGTDWGEWHPRPEVIAKFATLQQPQRTTFDERTFKSDNLTYRVVRSDYGPSSRKWAHQLENVEAVVFVTDLTCYDHLVPEDETVNRMEKSLTHFGNLMNSQWLSQASSLLILTNLRTFKERIRKGLSPLQNYCPDYTGGNDPEAAFDYILGRFVSLQGKSKQIYTYLDDNDADSKLGRFFRAAFDDIKIKRVIWSRSSWEE